MRGPSIDWGRMFTNRRKVIAFVIIAIVILSGAAIAIIVLPSVSARSHQILEAGDYLEYSVSGFSNNTTFTSSDNITISGASESGVSYQLIGQGYPLAAGTIPDFGHDFNPYDCNPPGIDSWFGNEMLSTAFGTKCVRTMLSYHNDEVILADIGIDSFIVYRWTVSSFSGAYRYAYELTSTNNSRISTVDAQMEEANIEALNTPSSTPGTIYVSGLSPPASTYSVCSGSVKVAEGEQFHYVLYGSNITMYVFNITDFRNIEETGQFHYNVTLSRLPGNPGETNVTVSPGIYWFIEIYRGSDTSVDFNGEQVGGYLIPYFD